MSGENYSEKNVLEGWGEGGKGGFQGEKFSEGGLLSKGELFRSNCSEVVVFGGTIQE